MNKSISPFPDLTPFEAKMKARVYNAESAALMAFKALIKGFQKSGMSRAQLIKILEDYWREDT